METIDEKVKYEEALKRLEELLPLVDDSTNNNDPNFIELMNISSII